MITTITDRQDWEVLLDDCRNSDCHHTFDYHQLSKRPNEQPFLLRYSADDTLIGLPLITRQIPGTPYKDVTSAYGYLGPITNKIPDNFDNTAFTEELKSYFFENNIVSVFSRLNPYVENQERCLKGLGEISTIGKVVNIDITKNLEDQRDGYSKRMRTYINKSRKFCSVRLAHTESDIDKFIAIYYENMKRVGAKDDYFFDEVYFYNLLGSLNFETDILLAVENESDKIIGGAMFLKKNDVVHYHLAGSKSTFLHYNAIKLLIDEMRKRATFEKFRYFNLGGGVGGQEDSLFYFKSSFSKDFKAFKVWRYIVNPRIYRELVNENKYLFTEKSAGSFFPLYRYSPK